MYSFIKNLGLRDISSLTMFHIFNLLYPLILISYLSRAVGFENYAIFYWHGLFAFYAFVFCELGVEYSSVLFSINT